ncbi:hypothetical protein NMY22_g11830 [Coprinellus aureogranulatus]|nr:hypothetical protein NMY22_g11830 [Coprinellus aureogranulatus]
MAPVMSCLIPSNPDVSGIGVRIAIYIQNLLCFIPALWALWDGKVTNYEMDSAEAHSTTNLVLAFAILISCIFQALARGLTNYHGSIILSLSWMNNTNAFIYFLLYVQYRSQGEAGIRHYKDWVKHIKTQFKTIFYLHDGLRGWWPFKHGGSKKQSKRNEGPGGAKVLFKRIALLLGSLHLTLMAALGIWLWSAPQSFGASESAGCVTQVADLAVVGAHIRFGSLAFRIVSLTIYSLILIPGLNLVLPMALFLAFHCWYHSQRLRQPSLLPEYANRNTPVSTNIQDIQPEATTSNVSSSPQQLPPPSEVALSATIRQVLPVYVGLLFLLAVNIVFIADIELTLQRNGHLQTEEESQWGFGQILALLLIFMPLRDLVEALFRRRQEMQTKLNDALKTAVGEKNLDAISRWVGAGADVNVQGDEGRTALSVACSQTGQRQLLSLLIDRGVDPDTMLTEAIHVKNSEYISLCVEAGACIDVRTDEGRTVLEIACSQTGQAELVSLLIDKGMDNNTILAEAICAKDSEYISLCIKAGADVNVKSAGGQTALDVGFSREGQHQFISLLSEKGLDLNAVLIKAIDEKNVEYISRCATYGADVNVQGAEGQTALDVALIEGDLEDLISLLATKGGRLDQALIKAVKAKDPRRIGLLARAGADINTEAPDGCTALDVALLRDDQDHLISLLVARGVDLDKGLIKAINAKNCHQISVLVKAGADLNTEGAGGLTAVNVALLQDDRDDLFSLLLTKGMNLDQALAKAIDAKDCEQIFRLVTAGADINTKGDERRTALGVAFSQTGQEQLIHLLISKGVDLNKALIEAISTNDSESISGCVEYGGDIHVQAADGRTALDVAFSRQDQHQLIAVLVKKGVNLDRVLTKAITSKKFHYISQCVYYGAKIDMQAIGRDALDVALSRQDQHHLMSLLVMNGVDLNEVLVQAITAKEWGAISGCVHYGTDVNVKAADGKTALELAILEDQWDLVRSLVEAGADVNQQFRSGESPEPALRAAFDKDAPIDVLELMLEKGADPNAQGGQYNNTCLHWACLIGRENVVSLLLKYRANPDIQDGSQGTPLHNACRLGHAKCAQVLLDAGANINARNMALRTDLHEACFNGHVDCVKLLLERGVDASIQDYSGKTAFRMALRMDHSEVLKLLRSHGVTR